MIQFSIYYLPENTERQIHERSERAVCAGDTPNAHVFLRILGHGLGYQTADGTGVGAFLDACLETGTARVGFGVVVAKEVDPFNVDRVTQIGSDGQHPVTRHVVDPFALHSVQKDGINFLLVPYA